MVYRSGFRSTTGSKRSSRFCSGTRIIFTNTPHAPKIADRRKGETIKHAELWKEVYVRTRGQLIVAEEGRHSYSEWLDTEMKRRER